MGLGGSPPKGWAVLMIPLLPDKIHFIRMSGNQMFVRTDPMPTPERGHALLELEKMLRKAGFAEAEVFLEPRGDINALRLRLRGVKTDA